MTTPQLIQAGMLRLDLLARLGQKPAPFAPGEALFWDDPYIARQMLAVHLDPGTDAASRRPAVIAQTVRSLVSYLQLRAGDAVLDLGCGPGLYCAHLARQGLRVTGLDYSRNSIAYATQQAADSGLPITYIYGNYLETPFPAGLDAVFMIYGDLCVLPPAARVALLHKVRAALKDSGHFVFDVTTRRHRQRVGARNSWAVAEAGFWRPGPHLVLTQGFDYPEADLYLDQYIIVTADGAGAVYRNWFQDYSLATISAVLERAGFAVAAAWGDLTGGPYHPEGEWIGIAAAKG